MFRMPPVDGFSAHISRRQARTTGPNRNGVFAAAEQSALGKAIVQDS
jgi:hypothetical protein